MRLHYWLFWLDAIQRLGRHACRRQRFNRLVAALTKPSSGTLIGGWSFDVASGNVFTLTGASAFAENRAVVVHAMSLSTPGPFGCVPEFSNRTGSPLRLRCPYRTIHSPLTAFELGTSNRVSPLPVPHRRRGARRLPLLHAIAPRLRPDPPEQRLSLPQPRRRYSRAPMASLTPPV